jgi:GNAT superfamily N-acetyltransferase
LRGSPDDVPVQIVEADLDRADHQGAVLALTAAYARDPMGRGEPLPEEVLDKLIGGLRNHPTTVILLALVGGEAAAIATCFLGFSTFAAKPLLNIHDLAVLPEHRGRKLGRRLLDAVERKARALGCCSVTLEVLERNAPARGLYEAAGFGPGVGEKGNLLFCTKPLT